MKNLVKIKNGFHETIIDIDQIAIIKKEYKDSVFKIIIVFKSGYIEELNCRDSNKDLYELLVKKFNDDVDINTIKTYEY